MWEACVLPILTYEYVAQMWLLTDAQTRRLVATQRSMERSILGIRKKDKIRAKTIREKTNCRGVVHTIKKLKIKYAGHIARMGDERWGRKITFWVPYGHKRRRGRPVKSWRDEIIGKVGLPWCRVAQDRRRWKEVGDAYARDMGAWYDR